MKKIAFAHSNCCSTNYLHRQRCTKCNIICIQPFDNEPLKCISHGDILSRSKLKTIYVKQKRCDKNGNSLSHRPPQWKWCVTLNDPDGKPHCRNLLHKLRVQTTVKLGKCELFDTRTSSFASWTHHTRPLQLRSFMFKHFTIIFWHHRSSPPQNSLIYCRSHIYAASLTSKVISYSDCFVCRCRNRCRCRCRCWHWNCKISLPAEASIRIKTETECLKFCAFSEYTPCNTQTHWQRFYPSP